jgi:hypothetical protein
METQYNARFMTEPENYEDLLYEDKIIFTFPVLWEGWECDPTAWVMERKDGTRYLKMTDHGSPYEAKISELISKIFYYETVIQKSKNALELLIEITPIDTSK